MLSIFYRMAFISGDERLQVVLEKADVAQYLMQKFKSKASKAGKTEKLVEKAFKNVARLLPEGRKNRNLDEAKRMDWVRVSIE